MRPLQDQCEPTSYEDIEKMFLSDEQKSISETFEFFDQRPIGVASLAQVHVGRLRGTGQEVAVKVCPPEILFKLPGTQCNYQHNSSNIPTSQSFAISTWIWSRLHWVRPQLVHAVLHV